MSRHAALCVVLWAFVCGTVVFGATEVPSGPGFPYTLVFKNVTYSYDDLETSFYYDVVNDGSQPINHVLLVSQCQFAVANHDEWSGLPVHDPATGLQGYKYSLGVDAHTTRTIVLRLYNVVAYGSLQYAIKAGHEWAQAPTVGPTCDGTGSDPSKFTNGSVPCSSSTTEFPCNVLPEVVGFVRSEHRADPTCAQNWFDQYWFSYQTGANAYAECSSTFHFVDKVPPQFDPAVLEAITVPCQDPLPPLSPPNVTDTCDPNVKIDSHCEAPTNGSCPNDKFYTYTYTAVDSCGNSKCITQTIAVIDTQAPEFNWKPQDYVLECTKDRTLPSNYDNITVTDHGCTPCYRPDANGQNISFTQTQYPGECANTWELLRKWTVTDCCGNSNYTTQKITLVDTTPPVLSFTTPYVTNQTVECDAVPPVPTVTAQDNCTDVPIPVNYRQDQFPGTCPNNYILKRTWWAVDDCNNNGTLVAYVYVQDSVFPHWTSPLPNNTDAECGSVPPPANVTAADNCGPVNVTYSETRTNTSCPNEYILNRTWTATDECFHSIYHTQIIHVYDTTPVRYNDSTVAELGPYQCAWQVPSTDSIAGAIQTLPPTTDAGCDQSYTPSSNSSTTQHHCINDLTIQRYYTTTDCSGNQDIVPRTIIVNDTVAPQFTLPGDASVPCHDVPALLNLTANDNCDHEVPVHASRDRTNGACPYNYTLVDTYWAEDVCGNRNTQTRTLTVSDNVPPVITPKWSLPGQYQCDAVPTPPNVSVSDNCGTAPLISGVVRTNGSCINSYNLTYSYSATDECGNTDSWGTTVQIVDTTAPVILDGPANTTASCDNIPIPAKVCVSDNCAGVTVVYSQTNTTWDCPTSGYKYVLTRTWTATDACGNVATHVQTISVYDHGLPVWTPQGNSVTDCANPQFPPAPTASDLCSVPTITNQSRIDNGTCPQNKFYRFIATAVDDCGNSAQSSYTVEVKDTTPPNFTVPANVTVECPSQLPPLGWIPASDDCDTTVTQATPTESWLPYTCIYDRTLVRTFTATDSCGNQASGHQYLTVFNSNPPVLSAVAPNVSYECAELPPPVVTANDSCGLPLNVSLVVTNYSFSCTGNNVKIRTWTATDSCGRSSSVSQWVTIFDNSAPQLNAPSGTLPVQCVAPRPPDVCVEDNCPVVTLNYTETRSNGSCPYEFNLTRTWTATDNCGATNSSTQTIIVTEVGVPTFAPTKPNDFANPCVLPPVPTPTAQGACNETLTPVDWSHTTPNEWGQNGPNCYDRHVSFRATDACGNFAWYNYTIHVQDRTAPTATFVPALANATFECGWEPGTPLATPSDNCDLTPTVSGPTRTNLSADPTCIYVYVYRQDWTVTDDCGNTTPYWRTVTGLKPAPPTFDQEVADDTRPCHSPAVVPNVTATDDCGHSIPVSLNITTEPGNCPHNYTEVRTWTATDVCGQTITLVQRIHYYDNQAPSVTAPNDYTEADKCTLQAVRGTATATDNCDTVSVGTPTWTPHYSPTCKYSGYVNYTYSATDACQNTGYDYLTVTYTHTIPPHFDWTPSATLEVPCDNVTAPDELTAKDKCNETVPVGFEETRVNDTLCPNEYHLLRVWTATDSCGLTHTFTQTVFVYDRKPPTLENVPGDTSVLCGFVPAPANVTASDTCGPVNVTLSETTINGTNCCDYQVVRVWTAKDRCNNTASATQTIQVYLDVPPEIEGPPDMTVPCPWTEDSPVVKAYKPRLATAFCVQDQVTLDPPCSPTGYNGVPTAQLPSPATALKQTGNSVFSYLNGTVLVDVEFTDDANNVYVLKAVLTNKHTFATKTLPALLNLNGSCYNTDPSGIEYVNYNTWAFYGTATGFLQGPGFNYSLSAGTQHESQVGKGASGWTRGWGATFFFSFTAGGTTYDFDVPVSLVKDGTGDCEFDRALYPDLRFCENCNLTVNLTRTLIPGDCPAEYTLIRKWCTWFIGYELLTCVKQTVTVVDESAPIVDPESVPDSGTIDCDEPWPPQGTINATDACSDVRIVPTYNDIPLPGAPVCASNVRRQFHYDVYDSCNNTATAGYWIDRQDTAPPTLQGIPANDITLECNTSYTLPNVTAWDDCGIDANAWPQMTPTHWPGSCPDTFHDTYTYTAVDNCGNSFTDSFSVYREDTHAPTLNDVPTNVVLQCYEPFPGDPVTATDLCDPNPTIERNISWLNSSCPNVYSATRTWVAVDRCGNRSPPHTQSIIVRDDEAPQFSHLPEPELWFSCEEVTPQETLTATDRCSTVTVIPTEIRVNSTTCPNTYTLFRTWTATDCAGNTNTTSQTVHVNDTTAPSIDPAPGNLVVNCHTQVPTPPSLCVSDNCVGVEVDYTQTITRLDPRPACDRYTINRTWVATDGCGNTNSTSYEIRVYDDVAPVCTFDSTPKTASCEVAASVVIDPPACTENCSTVHRTPYFETLPGNCSANYVKVYAWRVEDDCGNGGWYNSSVTVSDTTPPFFTDLPADHSYACDAQVPFDQPTANDNCDAGIASRRIFTSDRINTSCPSVYTIVRHWTLTDECGNVGVPHTQTIPIFNNYAPEWAPGTVLPPESQVVSCDNVPAPPELVAVDKCGDHVEVDFDETRINGSCINSYLLIRTWTATSCAGQQLIFNSTITVQDIIPPHIDPAPANTTAVCNNIPPPPGLCVSDNCDGVTFTYNQTRTSTAPPDCDRYVLTRTWVATDACGNTANTSYTITVNDQTAPTCTGVPPPNTLFADCENPNAHDPTAPTCTDNCGKPVNVTLLTSTQPNGCTYNYTKLFSWYAVDKCGNFAWYNTSVTVRDNHDPVIDITNLTPINVSCEVASLSLFATPTATDNCGTPTLTYVDSNSSTGACANYTVTRTWTAEDSCGRTATASQIMYVSDTSAPTLTVDPLAKLTFSCEEVVVFPNYTVSDNCDPNPTVTVTNTTTPSTTCSNARTILVTYTAVDACGWQTVVTRTITVNDAVSPNITSVPPVVNLDCTQPHPVPDVSCCDNCPGVHLTYTETRANGSCSSRYNLSRVWRCTDRCGNWVETSQLVIVTDNAPPQFDQTPPANGSFECLIYGSFQPENLTATDNCTGATTNYTAVPTSTSTVPGQCEANYSITVTYNAYDECGNPTQLTQFVESHDTIPPNECRKDIFCWQVVPTQAYVDYAVFFNVSSNFNLSFSDSADAFKDPLFCGYDACSPVKIVVTGCSSNQDVALNATFAGYGNFNSHCYYDNSTDQLFVAALIDTTDPGGRVYVVTADIIDACGHTTPTTRDIFLPLNPNSTILTFNRSDITCYQNNIPCDFGCTCQTVDHYCPADGSFGATLTANQPSPGSDADIGAFTQYSYTLRFGAQVPDRITVGIDLSKFEVFDVQPDHNVFFGVRPGSYIDGITWELHGGTVLNGSSYSFVVKGSPVNGDLAYQLGGFATQQDEWPIGTCSSVLTVPGPASLPTSPHADGYDDVTGSVVIAGLLGGTATNLSLGLPGVVVFIVDSTAANPLAPVFTTETDASGQFHFYHIPTGKAGDYRLYLPYTDGFLNLDNALRTSAAFLFPATASAGDPSFRWGPAQPLSTPNFALFFDDNVKPNYRRTSTPTHFQGNSEILNWWQYQLSDLSLPGGYLHKPLSYDDYVQLALRETRTHALADFFAGNNPPDYFGSDAFIQELKAAALNTAWSHGFFEPYGQAQYWILKLGNFVASSGLTDDKARVQALLHFVNTADDMD